MPTRGISLEREETQKVFVTNRGDAFRLRVTAVEEVLMPKEIFLFQRTLADPYDQTTADQFVAIASPFDVTIYPIDDPTVTQYPQFFRKDQIDLLFPSTEMATEAWDAIHAAVCNLVAAYNRLDLLSAAEKTRCGAEYVAPTSVSASESTSESF